MTSMTLALILAALMASDPRIETVVGTGEEGFSGDGGPAVRARLDQPFDVALNSRGDLYLSDTFNHRIRRVDRQTKVITTVAGSGEAGFSGDGGPAATARLNEPYGIVLDSRDNLFFADRLNHRIRRVDGQTGAISTVAGNGTMSSSGDGGPGNLAGLVEPNGVALDANNHLFIADVAGHRIRMVDLSTGLISTFAGTGRARHDGDGGPAGSASIWGARAVEVGPDGTVFVLEREGNTLRTVNPQTGKIATIAGTGKKGYTGDGGPPLHATFDGPKELAVDRSGTIYIVDTENHAIRAIDPEARSIRSLAGNGLRGGDGDLGPATRARLDRPHGVAADSNGNIWIGDTNNHRIRFVSTK